VTPEGLDRVTDAAVLASAQRVEVRPDSGIAERLCRVHVHLREGRGLHAMIDTPVGQPDFDELARFARALAPEMGATAAAVDRLIAAVAELDRAPDTRDLMAAALACRPS
jgi:hypothetical protein